MKRKVLREFILSLPGTNSYCECENPCSNIEVEHVIPKKELKDRIDKKLYLKAVNDPHNLFRCCSYLNRQKGCQVLGSTLESDIDFQYYGMLSRSCLYMDHMYNLKFNPLLIHKWVNFSTLFPPFNFERERNKLIYEKTGKINIFID